MLKVFIGDKPGGLGVPDAYFNIEFDKTNIETDWSKDVIYNIEGSKVFDKNVIVSPIFGGVPTTRLATGVKNLLIAKYCPKKVVNWIYMGENCLPYLFGIAKDRDLEVAADCYYDPYSNGYNGDIFIVNDGTIVKDSDEFFDKWLEYRGY